MRTASPLLLLVAAALSCGETRECDLVACIPSAIVTFASPEAGPYKLEISGAFGAYAVNCPGEESGAAVGAPAARCDAGGVTLTNVPEGLQDARARVTITPSGGQTRAVDLKFTRSRPETNGCSATCDTYSARF